LATLNFDAHRVSTDAPKSQQTVCNYAGVHELMIDGIEAMKDFDGKPVIKSQLA